LPKPAIKTWLIDAVQQLSAVGIPSARLDAEIILAHSIDDNRTYLHAHTDQVINDDQLIAANRNLDLRLKRIPIAYIVGYKEFYGRNFIVNNSTLIPRPESEDIITILKSLRLHSRSSTAIKLVDIGTGSGCLGITAKLELPSLNVTLIDISPDALKVAKQNATNLSADVKITNSNLLQSYDDTADMIIANLPYVDQTWDRSPETDHEPKLALFANDNGLSIIKNLIDQSVKYINPNGYLILESDPIQHQSLIKHAIEKSFKYRQGRY